MNNTNVHQGQSLFDIAIQESGSVFSAFDWALKNGKSVTDVLIVGESLDAPETFFKSKSVQEYFISKRPATNTTAQDIDIIPDNGGIDFMIIEDTFIVSS